MSCIDDRKIIPWVEKYRPKRLDQVIYQDEALNVLKKCLKGGDFPNLLFYGPPGTGKTSTILALAKEMFEEMFSSRVLGLYKEFLSHSFFSIYFGILSSELNASDERGISVIREKVKKFAQQTATGIKANGDKCPAFKIIILDEADCMTAQAQSCLRRVMEKATKNTRFCIICNYISRIIDPIVSRCSKFRFKPLQEDLIFAKLKEICINEDVKLENEEVLNELIRVSNGDLRKALTFLQTGYRFKGSKHSITVNDIKEISGYIPDEWVYLLVKACRSQSYEDIQQVILDLIAEGFSGYQMVIQLHDWVVSELSELSDKQISKICETIALTDQYLLEGADEFLQLLNVSSVILEELKN